jgi:hypothetical protein
MKSKLRKAARHQTPSRRATRCNQGIAIDFGFVVQESKKGESKSTIVKEMITEGQTKKDFVYKFRQENGTFSNLTSRAALVMLRQSLRDLDSESLNIKADECGLHSLWSSSAMAMYLNGIPVYTIMLLGRWSSDAFLRYIRKQVTEFSKGVARKMIQRPVYFHVSHAELDDPRTHNRLSSAANSGMGHSGNDVTRGAFAVWE